METSERPDPLAPPEGYGESPAEARPDTICDVHETTFWAARVRCSSERARVLTIGCDHEHVEEVDVCEWHITVLEQRDFWVCTACQKACDDGRCPLAHPHGDSNVRILRKVAV